MSNKNLTIVNENLMDDIKLSRLRLALAQLKVTKSQIALDTGYSKATVGAVLEGKTPLTTKFSKIFCSTYSINELWLESGEGPMIKNTNGNLIVSDSTVTELTPDPARMTLEQKLTWLGFKTKDIRQIQEWSKLSEEEQDAELKRLCMANIEKGRY